MPDAIADAAHARRFLSAEFYVMLPPPYDVTRNAMSRGMI